MLVLITVSLCLIFFLLHREWKMICPFSVLLLRVLNPCTVPENVLVLMSVAVGVVIYSCYTLVHLVGLRFGRAASLLRLSLFA